MAKIKFCALGGLGENGKNLYVFDIDNKIFILDAGTKHPSFDLYGIDIVIPDITYLLENKDRIQGIFLSHGHADHVGAVPEILKHINVGVYGTNFTLSLVELELAEAGMNIEDYKLYRININKDYNFGNVTVNFYSTSHSVPESCGIALKTSDGALVYAPDFNFASNTDPRYQVSFGRLVDVAKNGVLALFSESLGAGNIGRASDDYQMLHHVGELLQKSKRVIFSMFSNELQRIQKIINICIANGRRVAIIGLKVQKTINVAMKNGYLKIPEDKLVTLKYMTDEIKNDDDDLAIIITGNRHEPYYTLQRMTTGVDRLIKIKEDDQVIIISQPMPGTEILAQKVIGLLHRANAKVNIIPKSLLQSSHADSEDLKLLYNMLKPKYIVPVVGEYRHQVMQKNIALDAGYPSERILLLDNGDLITFENKQLQPGKQQIKSGDVLVDGSFVGDINEVVLKDREMLSHDGLILVVTTVDARLKKVIAGPKVVLKGFMAGDTAKEVIESIEEITVDIVEDYFKKKYIDWNDLKNDLRDAINKSVFKMTNKSPIIMPSLIDVESERE
ncbi:MAG TPA: ribonuclease J [Acholeplasmataceae bacterium]|nr:ribonuclease J [Acholeplasmataceae bacterium]